MEGTENQDGAAAVLEPAEQAAQPAAEPEAGDPGGRAPDRAALAQAMNGFMRGAIGGIDPTSKPDPDEATGEPAPDSGDVEAGGSPERGADGRFISRRGVPEAVKSAEERAAAAEQRLAELEGQRAAQEKAAESSRLDELAKTQAEAVARYRRLIEVPDDDLYRDDPEGYAWREAYKAKLASFPEVAEFHRVDAEQRIEAAAEEATNQQRGEIFAAAREFGVDPEGWKRPGTTWLSMTRDSVEAVAAPLRERIATLERQLHGARVGSLGAARTPAEPGRSSAGAPVKTMNDWLRTG